MIPYQKQLKYYFDGHTTVASETDFIVFNIKELMNSADNIRNALFFNILKYAWGLCLNKDVNIKKSAFEEGYRAGLEKCNADLEKFRQSLNSFMNANKDVFEYIAPDILEISVDIAKKIIKKEVDADPQILIDTIVDILKTTSKNEPKIVIRVRPQAVQFIKDTIPNITYQYGIDSKINIVADPSVEEGGCIFQTNNGIVDASVDTQIEIIKKALEGM